jgi:RNA polymerase sigma-70 factor, ECF subfamily
MNLRPASLIYNKPPKACMRISNNNIQSTYTRGNIEESSEVDVDDLFRLTYQELRRRASIHKANWRNATTLTATGLVHETYEKVAGAKDCEMHNSSHFMAITSCAMRQVLLDHLKRHRAKKRGGGKSNLTFVESEVVGLKTEDDLNLLLEVSEAVERLQHFNPHGARVVECRFFAGLSISETAKTLRVSEATVKRRWRVARAWLKRELTGNTLTDQTWDGLNPSHSN